MASDFVSFTRTVRAMGKRSAQVCALRRAAPRSISYFVPGSRCTRLPRHSALRASYQSGSASRQLRSPALRKRIAQPDAPGSLGGVQYTPIDSNVETARGSAAQTQADNASRKTCRQKRMRAGWRGHLARIYRAPELSGITRVGPCTTALSTTHYNLEQKEEIRMVKRDSRAYTSRQQGPVLLQKGTPCEFS